MRKFFFITSLIILYFIITTIYPFINSIQETVQTNITENEPTYSTESETAYSHHDDDATLNYEKLMYEQEMEQSSNDTDIVELYANQFTELENDILEELDLLRAEVVEQLREDMNALTFGVKLLEYESKIRNIEAYADQQFATLYEQMVDELSQNNLSMEIAEDFEKKYDTTKRRVQREILKEARHLLGDKIE